MQATTKTDEIQARYLSEEQAAKYLGESKETLAKARRSGLIIPFRFSKKSYKYTIEILDEYAKSTREN